MTGQSDVETDMDTTTTTLFILLSQTEKHDFNPLGFYVVKTDGTLTTDLQNQTKKQHK
jgi:hypothetical protein